MLMVFIILLCAFLWGYLFLGSELLKKFGILGRWAESTTGMVNTYQYQGSKKRRMGNLVIRSDDGKPFSVITCIRFYLLPGLYCGIDPYGQVASSNQGVIVVRTYLGKNPVMFVYIANRHVQLTVSLDDDGQLLKPDAIHKPHLIQWLF